MSSELNFTASIIGHDGRQVVGRSGFKKTRSQQQRLLPKPYTPHQKPASKSLSTTLKRRSCGGGLRVVIYNLLLAKHCHSRYNNEASISPPTSSISLSVLNKLVSLITVWSQSLLLMRKLLSSLHISIPVNSAEGSEIKKLSACSQEVSYSALVLPFIHMYVQIHTTIKPCTQYREMHNETHKNQGDT